MKELILASTSRYRRALLERLGLSFRVVAPCCDERGLDHLSVEARALRLAERKARSVPPGPEGALVIGSDQIAEVDGLSLQKPGSFEKARETLRLLSGKEHRLVTAVALVDTGSDRLESVTDVATLRMRSLTDAEIDHYLEREEPFDCVGAYRIEGLGIALFEAVETNDPTGIVGLPLTAVVRLLSRFGIAVLR